MRRLLTGFAGAFGIAALWRYLQRRPPEQTPAADPAEELRRKLAEARGAADDRDEYDSAEGIPVDEVDEPGSLEERRKAVHDRAQQAIDRMQDADQD